MADPTSAQAAYAALIAFGAPLADISVNHLCAKLYPAVLEFRPRNHEIGFVLFCKYKFKKYLIGFVRPKMTPTWASLTFWNRLRPKC